MKEARQLAAPILEQSPTRFKTLSNLMVCEGEVCKRSVPKESLLASWKKDDLWQASHLSFSDCMGPCDLASNACVLSEAGRVWLSGLGVDDFVALAHWALACKQKQRLLELPKALRAKQITRYEHPSVMTLERKKT
ncbi:MAG: hypothetical protein ACRCYY_04030 [Trueperaceae bacterium]